MMVKICGITNREDALAAVEAGAGAIGLNFCRESPRYVSPTGASVISEKLPPNVLKVGIFVDESADNIARTAMYAGLDVVQLHGMGDCPSMRTWRAAPVADSLAISYFTEDDAEAFLLDTASTILHGGTGKTFRWEIAREAAQFTTKHIIIAGGLDETNVQAAIAEAQPWGVDACSRLESSPGKKDRARMQKFIEAALNSPS